jgi:hypothetical protein
MVDLKQGKEREKPIHGLTPFLLVSCLLLTFFLIGCTSSETIIVNRNDPSFKAHRIETVSFVANEWKDINWEIKIDEESTDNIGFLNEGLPGQDNTIIVVDAGEKILKVNGCIHSKWVGPVGSSVDVFSRVLVSYDEGVTWRESRCLQVNESASRGVDAEGTNLFAGTVRVVGVTWVKLQVRVSNSNMLLESNPVFDNSVAATIFIGK